MDGTAFVDVSDPYNPRYVGSLPLHDGARPASWRDIKVYADHAYIVSEMTGHDLQIFDLATLRDIGSPPAALIATAGENEARFLYTDWRYLPEAMLSSGLGSASRPRA